MKQYCVDLEIAKELKINGFPQKINRFCWVHGWTESLVGKEEHYSIGYNIKSDVYEIERFFAPISDELLKELPHEVNGSWLLITPVGKGYEVGYWEGEWNKEATENDPLTRKIYEHYLDKKLSNALSNLWLYLKKEGYIK